jgi:nitroreductase
VVFDLTGNLADPAAASAFLWRQQSCHGLMEAMDEFLGILRSLRATRRFRPDAVADSVIAEIIDVARWTGSARNRQPWRVTVLTDAQHRGELARLGAYAAFLEATPLVLLLAVERHSGGADAEFDAGRFAQTIMLAAHVRGLGSCPASFFPEENVEAATALTGLTEPWRARTAIAIGYPDLTPPPGARSAIPTGRLPADVITTSDLR